MSTLSLGIYTPMGSLGQLRAKVPQRSPNSQKHKHSGRRDGWENALGWRRAQTNLPSCCLTLHPPLSCGSCMPPGWAPHTTFPPFHSPIRRLIVYSRTHCLTRRVKASAHCVGRLLSFAWRTGVQVLVLSVGVERATL